MRRPSLQFFAIFFVLRALHAAPPAEAPTAPSPPQFPLVYSASYEATFERLDENEPLNKKPEAGFFAVRMVLTSEQGALDGPHVRRFVASNVRVVTDRNPQFADPKNVEQLRQFFEKVQLPLPTGADGVADYERLWGSSSSYSDEYTQAIARALIPPPCPLPPTNQRGDSIALREDAHKNHRNDTPRLVYESNARIVPHICSQLLT